MIVAAFSIEKVFLWLQICASISCTDDRHSLTHGLIEGLGGIEIIFAKCGCGNVCIVYFVKNFVRDRHTQKMSLW